MMSVRCARRAACRARRAPQLFGEGLGHVDAVSMIQSNIGTPGNLEVIARVGGDLYHFFRPANDRWIGPNPLGLHPSLYTGRTVATRS